MQRFTSALTAFILLAQLQFAFASPQETKKTDTQLQLTPEQWRQDLQYLAKELPRRHKNAFHTVSREQFERSVADLNARIPNLQPHEIVVELMRIVASIGDAHTELSGFGASFHRFPLSVFWFDKELRVTRIASAYKSAIGARVMQVGDLRIEDATARLDPLIPHENEYWVRFRGAGYMTYAEILHAAKVIPDSKIAQWTFEDSNGKRFSLNIPTVEPGQTIEWVDATDELPLYRQRPDEQIWFTHLADAKTIYVNFRGYRDEFDKHAEELLTFIRQHPENRLIIDMRQNRGGDFTKVRKQLLPGLKQNSCWRKPGTLFIVTGRATQSAAVVNTIDFRKELNAVVVGEPTGGKPNGYSEHGDFKLPNSKLVVSYSSRYYKFQDLDTPAVMPDKLIEPEWDAYRAGRDPVMEWILAQPLPK
jgi:hypothetical protein